MRLKHLIAPWLVIMGGGTLGALGFIVVMHLIFGQPAEAAPPDQNHRLTLALEANTRAVERLERTLGRCGCP